MPKTELTLYRGGYKNKVWPSDLRGYLIRRSEKGKDCEIFKQDDTLWVRGDPVRGLSLFATKEAINNPWRLGEGAEYPEQLTLIENPEVKGDWILAPKEDMTLDHYVILVETIAHEFKRDFVVDVRTLSALDPATVGRALRAQIDRMMTRAGMADTNEDEAVEISNDVQLLRLVLAGYEQRTTKLEELRGTAGALVREAIRSILEQEIDIKIGTVTTPNPPLWLDMTSLDGPTRKYEVSTLTPVTEGQWTNVNQFCAVLAVRFLQQPSPPTRFGFNDLHNPVEEARVLLGFESLEDQLQWAEGALSGVIIKEDIGHFYDEAPVGTIFWLGTDVHSWAVIKEPKRFILYDPDNGRRDYVGGSDFSELVKALGINAAIMAHRA